MTASHYLKMCLMRSTAVLIQEILGYYKMKICKHLAGLHNLVNYSFPNNQLHEVIKARMKKAQMTR